MVDHIPKYISTEENEKMTKLPDHEKVKRVVFVLNGSIGCGTNGFLQVNFFKVVGNF